VRHQLADEQPLAVVAVTTVAGVVDNCCLALRS